MNLYNNNQVKLGISNIWLRSLVINFLIWGSIIIFGAWGSYLDNVPKEPDLLFYNMSMSWVELNSPLFVLSTCLYLVLKKYPNLVANTSNITRLFLFLTVFYFPLYILFKSFANWKRFDQHLHYKNFLIYVFDRHNTSWLFDYAGFVGVIIAVIAMRLWHENKERHAALLQTQTDNLKLNLALEQQRLHSLRQQLEPHFIFNALNGISALVRSNEQTIALNGIHRLSELLRYALSATNKNWVSLQDELSFVRDYLALQNLRYGQRLVVNIVGDTPEMMHGDCPPLLLQPLIENALRHDLDCHENESVIDIAFQEKENNIHIQIQNNIRNQKSSNPGLGLGLPQTQQRLELMYKGKATLDILHTSDRFIVNMTIPKFKPE